MNYGGGGFVAGHEMSHGVHNWIRNGPSNYTRNQMDIHGQCIISQAESVVEPQSKSSYANATGILSEMLADIGAVNVSYTALQSHPNKDQVLPGAAGKFSPAQLFFLSAANTWCHNAKTKSIKSTLEAGFGHPFNYHRVVVPVMNNYVFADAFKCKSGSRMNPVRKCVLW